MANNYKQLTIVGFYIPIYHKDVYLYYNHIRMMPLFVLVILLFWQKRKINIFIVMHFVIASALYLRGIYLYPSDWGDSPEFDANWIFNAIYISTKNFVQCILFLWTYEWWYIGRRRSQINGEW